VIAGNLYVWPDCFRMQNGKETIWLATFFYSANGGLWPRPIVGEYCSKEPKGEGVPVEWVHSRYKQARES